jgi:hypothetical protein
VSSGSPCGGRCAESGLGRCCVQGVCTAGGPGVCPLPPDPDYCTAGIAPRGA